jgi:hypothetical protein
MVSRGFKMFAAAFTYSLLSGFVLSSASRNKREGRGNPPMLDYVGYGLVGVSIVISLILAYLALTGEGLPVE